MLRVSASDLVIPLSRYPTMPLSLIHLITRSSSIKIDRPRSTLLVGPQTALCQPTQGPNRGCRNSGNTILRRNLAAIDNCLLIYIQIHHHFHYNDDLMASPPEFARVLHREGISAIRARTSFILILLHSSCKTSLSCSRLSHLLLRIRCLRILQIASIGFKSGD